MAIEENTFAQFEEIKQRCEKAKIEVKLPDNEDNKSIMVLLQTGRNKREIPVKSIEAAKMLLSIPFENIRGISGYRAFWSIEDRFIEATIESFRRPSFPSALYKELKKALRNLTPKESQDIEDEETQLGDNADNSRIEIQSDNEPFKEIKVSLGLATTSVTVLESLRKPLFSSFLEARKRPLVSPTNKLSSQPMTIRIEGIDVKQHDQAVNILTKIANSVLFQLDILTGLPFYLAIEENTRAKISKTQNYSNENEKPSLVFPKYQYDNEPMSLYWYASTATGMPLIQYLGYYQVIEFYFPKCTQIEASNVVKIAFKNPSFHTNTDIHVNSLIGRLKPLLKGGYGEEKTALYTTIKNCVTQQEIKEFFRQDTERTKFYKEKKQWDSISSQKISVESEEADFITEVKNRIYDIRCKIVHTKSLEAPEEIDMILPFSEEATKLHFDIELVQFIARKVIISLSEPLTL